MFLALRIPVVNPNSTRKLNFLLQSYHSNNHSLSDTKKLHLQENYFPSTISAIIHKYHMGRNIPPPNESIKRML